MDTQKTKIIFYAKRNFGEKMNASFDFIKENWKPILKYTTYLLLPLCLLQALSLNGLMSGTLNMASLQQNPGVAPGLASFGIMFFVSYGAMLLCAMIGGVLISSLLYALVQLYNSREERLVGITMKELKAPLMHNIKRSFILILVLIPITIGAFALIAVLGSLMPFLLIFLIPGFIAFMIPIMLLPSIYLFEKEGVWAAFTKTFRLGFATWGGIFAIVFVMGIIAGILQGITMTPWYVATIVKYMFTLSDPGSAVGVSPLYNLLVYLLAILQSFGTYLAMTFTLVGLAYQYAHANEVVGNVSVESDIEQFEQL
ncbi:hypothetical protein [Bacteroides ihuae]|uniref:hypothetical protein n=1 Tax=Bacteroides ihuae TaxID=1852362 RepID=UPI0008DA75D8|nr:hypothetical protein [Bacteroides ihuae]